MESPSNAFTHPATTSDLYRDASRLATRTSALHQAKVQGRPVAEVIVGLATDHLAEFRQATVATSAAASAPDSDTLDGPRQREDMFVRRD
jgi:hypothetical protein